MKKNKNAAASAGTTHDSAKAVNSLAEIILARFPNKVNTVSRSELKKIASALAEDMTPEQAERLYNRLVHKEDSHNAQI